MKYLLLVGALLFAGCSAKKTPVALQNTTPSVINKGILLDKHDNRVPLDPSFSGSRYSYIITTSKKGNVFFDNKIKVKAFYLLHHANLVVITGNRHVAKQYRSYLRKNGVTAPIKINATGIRSGKVIIDTIHYALVEKY